MEVDVKAIGELEKALKHRTRPLNHWKQTYANRQCRDIIKISALKTFLYNRN